MMENERFTGKVRKKSAKKAGPVDRTRFCLSFKGYFGVEAGNGAVSFFILVLSIF
jgi:hypothetical protein